MKFTGKIDINKIIQHLGFALANELKTRGINQKDFALGSGINVTELNEICKGKRNISYKFAITLESFFFGNAEFWIISQAIWNLKKIRSGWKENKVCDHKIDGSCPLNNIQCAYPKCEE